MVSQEAYDSYFESLLAGRRRKCQSIISAMLDQGIELKCLYMDLFQKSLYEIGHLWETGKVTVATEHMATAITEHLISLAYPSIFSVGRLGRTAIVSCTANEYHQIGGRMVADMMELCGWDSFFLGANTPVEQLIEMVQEIRPDILALSLSVYFNMPHLIHAIEQVRRTDADLPILVGGQAFRWGGKDIGTRYGGLHFLESLPQIETFLLSFKG